MFSWEAVGAVPLVSPAGRAAEALTTVVMMPAGVTSRMALLKVSAMNRSPAPSTATPCGSLSCGAGGGAAVAGEAAEAVVGLVGGVVAGHGGDDPGLGVHPADDVVGRVGDVQVALGVDREPGRLVQLGERGQAAVAGVAGVAVAGDGGDLPGGVTLTTRLL